MIVDAMGHHFKDDLNCDCSASWGAHQLAPRRCPICDKYREARDFSVIFLAFVGVPRLEIGPLINLSYPTVNKICRAAGLNGREVSDRNLRKRGRPKKAA